MELRCLLAVLLVACSGGRPKPAGDARSSATHGDAGAVSPGGYRVDDKAPKGDAAIRIEWHDVPIAARETRGASPCGTPLAPAVAPTTTWGIPDVFVWLDADHGKAVPPRDARIVLDHCALVPKVVVATSTLTVASATDAPAAVLLGREGDLAALAAISTVKGQGLRHVQLPVAGHAVDVALTPGIHELAIDGEVPERAWIVAAPTPYVVLTDTSGVATLRDVPAGTYPVVAWLAPPRTGTSARFAKGQITVTAGALAELTLDLQPVP